MMHTLVDQARAVPIEVEIERRGIVLKGTVDRCGPCPICGGTDRFSINTRKQVFRCRQCETGGDVIALVQHLDACAFGEAIELLTGDQLRRPAVQAPARAGQTKRTDKDRVASALQWWKDAGPIAGTIGIEYLERERGITELPPDVHDVMRFHPYCIYGQDDAGQRLYVSAIVCLLRDVITGKPTGVHRIALHPDGKLIGRMGLGIKQGSAVKLWGDAEITTALCVGEGIETTLAAATRVQHRNTLLRPAWSLVDAPNIASFPVLPGGAIEHLTILCDADHNETGQRAARTCAKRWAATGCDVEILIPNVLGEDFNDLIKRAA
jgi:phage/plasmid primase-like uncharacterized protein